MLRKRAKIVLVALEIIEKKYQESIKHEPGLQSWLGAELNKVKKQLKSIEQRIEKTKISDWRATIPDVFYGHSKNSQTFPEADTGPSRQWSTSDRTRVGYVCIYVYFLLVGVNATLGED